MNGPLKKLLRADKASMNFKEINQVIVNSNSIEVIFGSSSYQTKIGSLRSLNHEKISESNLFSWKFFLKRRKGRKIMKQSIFGQKILKEKRKNKNEHFFKKYLDKSKRTNIIQSLPSRGKPRACKNIQANFLWLNNNMSLKILSQ